MRIGVLGTGSVGQTIGSHLVSGGHEIRMGSRGAGNPKAETWAAGAGASASHGTFADAAAFADEVVFNCTSGAASLDVLRAAGAEALGTKILIDVANPLDFSRGMPPTLIVCNTESLAERIQAALPEVKVVKSLNTMNCDVMVNPALVPGEHNVFVAGNDVAARARVSAWLQEWFGWPPASVLDLGDLTAARGMEMILPIWLKLFGTFGNPYINFHIARGTPPLRRA
jgi:predicted dinucleotide-binding enzyme